MRVCVCERERERERGRERERERERESARERAKEKARERCEPYPSWGSNDIPLRRRFFSRCTTNKRALGTSGGSTCKSDYDLAPVFKTGYISILGETRGVMILYGA